MTLEEAKAYLRLETGQEDALIAGLVASATGVAEAYLGMPLIRRETADVLAADGRWRRLRTAPVHAITAVTDAEGAPLPARAYAIDIDPAGEGWVRASGAGRARVTYVAGGSASAAEVPPAIAQGVIRLTAHLYANRDEAAPPPAAVAALWRPHRRLRLGVEVRA
jgi:uncharacterized phiE125 gp8 family phage protein